MPFPAAVSRHDHVFRMFLDGSGGRFRCNK